MVRDTRGSANDNKLLTSYVELSALGLNILLILYNITDECMDVFH